MSDSMACRGFGMQKELSMESLGIRMEAIGNEGRCSQAMDYAHNDPYVNHNKSGRYEQTYNMNYHSSSPMCHTSNFNNNHQIGEIPRQPQPRVNGYEYTESTSDHNTHLNEREPYVNPYSSNEREHLGSEQSQGYFKQHLFRQTGLLDSQSSESQVVPQTLVSKVYIPSLQAPRSLENGSVLQQALQQPQYPAYQSHNLSLNQPGYLVNKSSYNHSHSMTPWKESSYIGRHWLSEQNSFNQLGFYPDGCCRMGANQFSLQRMEQGNGIYNHDHESSVAQAAENGGHFLHVALLSQRNEQIESNYDHSVLVSNRVNGENRIVQRVEKDFPMRPNDFVTQRPEHLNTGNGHKLMVVSRVGTNGNCSQMVCSNDETVDSRSNQYAPLGVEQLSMHNNHEITMPRKTVIMKNMNEKFGCDNSADQMRTNNFRPQDNPVGGVIGNIDFSNQIRIQRSVAHSSGGPCAFSQMEPNSFAESEYSNGTGGQNRILIGSTNGSSAIEQPNGVSYTAGNDTLMSHFQRTYVTTLGLENNSHTKVSAQLDRFISDRLKSSAPCGVMENIGSVSGTPSQKEAPGFALNQVHEMPPIIKPKKRSGVGSSTKPEKAAKNKSRKVQSALHAVMENIDSLLGNTSLDQTYEMPPNIKPKKRSGVGSGTKPEKAAKNKSPKVQSDGTLPKEKKAKQPRSRKKKMDYILSGDIENIVVEVDLPSDLSLFGTGDEGIAEEEESDIIEVDPDTLTMLNGHGFPVLSPCSQGGRETVKNSEPVSQCEVECTRKDSLVSKEKDSGYSHLIKKCYVLLRRCDSEVSHNQDRNVDNIVPANDESTSNLKSQPKVGDVDHQESNADTIEPEEGGVLQLADDSKMPKKCTSVSEPVKHQLDGVAGFSKGVGNDKKPDVIPSKPRSESEASDTESMQSGRETPKTKRNSGEEEPVLRSASGGENCHTQTTKHPLNLDDFSENSSMDIDLPQRKVCSPNPSGSKLQRPPTPPRSPTTSPCLTPTLVPPPLSTPPNSVTPNSSSAPCPSTPTHSLSKHTSPHHSPTPAVLNGVSLKQIKCDSPLRTSDTKSEDVSEEIEKTPSKRNAEAVSVLKEKSVVSLKLLQPVVLLERCNKHFQGAVVKKEEGCDIVSHRPKERTEMPLKCNRGSTVNSPKSLKKFKSCSVVLTKCDYLISATLKAERQSSTS